MSKTKGNPVYTVIKPGGSLLKSPGLLSTCLNWIEHYAQNQPVVIVPGGGVFADQVRLAQQEWRFNDDIAHDMAILAMQQMALLINGLKPGYKRVTHWRELTTESHNLQIWSPDVDELDAAGIAKSWDVTSDSLAAWLAGAISASRLILVKAVDVPADCSMQELQTRGIVDPAFTGFTGTADFQTFIVSASALSSWPNPLNHPFQIPL